MLLIAIYLLACQYLLLQRSLSLADERAVLIGMFSYRVSKFIGKSIEILQIFYYFIYRSIKIRAFLSFKGDVAFY